MKTFALMTILFLMFSSQSLAESSAPQPTCIPADQTDWPVKAIYLHGWFEASASGLTHSRRTEFDNRKHLEALARRLQIRIALPVAPQTNSRGMRTWNNSSLQDIERLSVSACGGAPLAEDRSLIGFSNGGFAAKNIGLRHSCEQLSAYRRVLAIGTQRNFSSRCNEKFTNVPAHVFPPENLLELTNQPLPSPAESERMLNEQFQSPSGTSL